MEKLLGILRQQLKISSDLALWVSVKMDKGFNHDRGENNDLHPVNALWECA